jgi:signal transduction histidine kinase
MLLYHESKNKVEVIKEFGQIPRIKCYPNHSNQIFMNILINGNLAIEGMGTIKISTGVEDDPVYIDIKNNGKRILSKNLNIIFNPGFIPKGIGVETKLGLSIINNIIQKHKENVEVSSKVGIGSIFSFILPLNLEEKEVSPEDQTPKV